jgi:ketosteroid isomerase-like protein
LYQWWHPKNSIHKVDGNVVHSIGTAGNGLWATGEWSETGQGKTGEPIPIKGYWFFIFVHEADDWKVRVTGGNVTLDSVILINKSFVLQPAGTPSPTASPATLATYARQRDAADPQTTQEVNASYKGYFEARDHNDAAAVAAYYTRDAVFLTPFGPIIGREAIQKWYADLYPYVGRYPKNLIYKLDGNAYHFIGTAGNELWCTGEWSDTGQGKNGEPQPTSRGYDADIFVREGDGWKLRVNAWNITPDSVIAGQPAATPPSTASPSGQ